MTTTTRHIGNCQLCEGDYKLADGRMVHHGYQRPGWGHIVGDCLGVGELPYEVSCDALRPYLAGLQRRIEGQREYLGKLRAGAIDELTVERRRTKFETVRRGDPSFGIELRQEIGRVEYGVRMNEGEVERVEKRIASWEPKPVRTVEEEQAKADAQAAERRAERDAARAAREAKKAATLAKQEAFKARRKAEGDALSAQFSELAEAGDKEGARVLLARLRNVRKYDWVWSSFDYDLLAISNAGESMVRLGLGQAYDCPAGRRVRLA